MKKGVFFGSAVVALACLFPASSSAQRDPQYKQDPRYNSAAGQEEVLYKLPKGTRAKVDAIKKKLLSSGEYADIIARMEIVLNDSGLNAGRPGYEQRRAALQEFIEALYDAYIIGAPNISTKSYILKGASEAKDEIFYDGEVNEKDILPAAGAILGGFLNGRAAKEDLENDYVIGKFNDAYYEWLMKTREINRITNEASAVSLAKQLEIRQEIIDDFEEWADRYRNGRGRGPKDAEVISYWKRLSSRDQDVLQEYLISAWKFPPRYFFSQGPAPQIHAPRTGNTATPSSTAPVTPEKQTKLSAQDLMSINNFVNSKFFRGPHPKKGVGYTEDFAKKTLKEFLAAANGGKDPKGWFNELQPKEQQVVVDYARALRVKKNRESEQNSQRHY